MNDLRTAFAEKYPQYANRVLNMYEQANNCPATWENISKIRLAKFVSFLNGKLAKSSVKTLCHDEKRLQHLQ